jgi:large subunit ribosomal protein L16
LAFGEYGLQVLEPGWITADQLEAGRVAVSHYLQREGRLHRRVFPHKPISAKPLETRMGKGKGEPEFWAAVVKPGTVMFEVAGVPEAAARECLARVAYKMPFKCRLIARRPNI